MKRVFLVEVDIPDGVGILEMSDHIEKEIRSFPGRYGPEDYIWYMDRDSVDVQNATVTRLKQLLKRIEDKNDT